MVNHSNKKTKVAIQGYEGSFHHIAAQGYLGADIEIVACDTFRQVAKLVESQEVELGIMAIENSIAGSILPNYNILQNRKVSVIGEIYLHIRQNLVANRGVSLNDITEVESHQMALLQCDDFLDQYGWKLVESEDTALSAKRIAQNGSRNTAAIASSLAAELFNLDIIAPDIHTIKNNYTRFLVLEYCDRSQYEKHPRVNIANKASLYFKIEDSKGSLFSTLQLLQGYDINMTKLQSYPIPTETWHYMFHVDMEFDKVEQFYDAIATMQNNGVETHIYGVYNKGRNI